MYRNTYVEIHLENISKNISKVLSYVPEYQYYFGVVKADGYGHGIPIISTLLNSGINYLAVATLEEALEIRNHFEVPILCLGIIDQKYLSLCEENNITITIPSLEYAFNMDNKRVKCHIKIDTGMHRLGLSTKEEFEKVYALLQSQVEGVYTHIYDASNQDLMERQIDLFSSIIEHHKDIPIIHCCASEALLNHKKRDFENGCRLGIVMYGLVPSPISLESTYSLISEIIMIQHLKKGDTLGYGGAYTALEDMDIGVIPIGYADGIIRKNEGRNVYIHNKPYPIIGHICMDMMFVKIDNSISIHDKVEVIKDNKHIEEIAAYLDTIPYEVICNIGKRVPRIWR